jgi:hypothetical protein
MRLHYLTWFILLIFVSIVGTGTALAQDRDLVVDPPGEQAGHMDPVDLVRASNPLDPFRVTLGTSNDRTTARQGENVKFWVKSGRAGYVTLLSQNAKGEITFLFPNKHATNQRVRPGQRLTVPMHNSFRIRVAPPFGSEIVKVLVTPEPLLNPRAAKEAYESRDFVVVPPTSRPNGETDDLGGLDKSLWNAASIRFTTQPREGDAAPSPPKSETLGQPEALDQPEVSNQPETPNQSKASQFGAPPLPSPKYGNNPASRWQQAFAKRAGRSVGSRSSQNRAEVSVDATDHDGEIVVISRPGTGMRAFGRSLENSDILGSIRVVDTKQNTQNGAGTRSLYDQHGQDFDAILRSLNQDSDVVAAFPNYRVHLQAPVSSKPLSPPLDKAPVNDGATTSTPTFWDLQWGLHNSFWKSASARHDMRWREAHQYIATDAKPVVVAVLDTGIRFDNSHLKNYFWRNPDEVRNDRDDDGNGYVDDIYGADLVESDRVNGEVTRGDGDPTDPNARNSHGTFVASQITGESDQLYGLTKNARIMPIRVLNRNGEGKITDLISGIAYAKYNGADIINMSIATETLSSPLPKLKAGLNKIFQDLGGSNVLVVMAAGNENSSSRRSFTYPARLSLPNTLTVAASGIDGNLAARSRNTAGTPEPFSNYGPRVDLAAPGELVAGLEGAGREVVGKSGTSVAASYASAAAAMVWAAHPSWTAAEVRSALVRSVTPVPGMDVKAGGMINLEKALR